MYKKLSRVASLPWTRKRVQVWKTYFLIALESPRVGPEEVRKKAVPAFTYSKISDRETFAATLSVTAWVVLHSFRLVRLAATPSSDTLGQLPIDTIRQ